MSDRNFNNFNDDFDDDFDDDDDFLDASESGARRIGGDRDSAVLRPFIQEIEQIPPEHLANLLQMIRLFRQSISLSEQSAKAEAQYSSPIQPTVLPPVESINTTPSDATPINTLPIESSPFDALSMRPQLEPPIEQTIEQVSEPPTELLQEPPLIPLRLPRTAESGIKPSEPAVEYGVKPAPTEDESDWDDLMDFLDQDSPKDFPEEDNSRNDDWDEYFRPSP